MPEEAAKDDKLKAELDDIATVLAQADKPKPSDVPEVPAITSSKDVEPSKSANDEAEMDIDLDHDGKAEVKVKAKGKMTLILTIVAVVCLIAGFIAGKVM